MLINKRALTSIYPNPLKYSHWRLLYIFQFIQLTLFHCWQVNSIIFRKFIIAFNEPISIMHAQLHAHSQNTRILIFGLTTPFDLLCSHFPSPKHHEHLKLTDQQRAEIEMVSKMYSIAYRMESICIERANWNVSLFTVNYFESNYCVIYEQKYISKKLYVGLSIHVSMLFRPKRIWTH